MAPPANQDTYLLFLQGRCADLRREHEDLVGRERVLRNFKYIASADELRIKVDKAYDEWHQASSKLAAYISRKQRSIKP